MPSTPAELEEKRRRKREKKEKKERREADEAEDAAAEEKHQRNMDLWRRRYKAQNKTSKDKAQSEAQLSMMESNWKSEKISAYLERSRKREAEKAAEEEAKNARRAQESDHDRETLPHNDFDFDVEDADYGRETLPHNDFDFDVEDADYDRETLPHNDFNFDVEDVESTKANADIRTQPLTATMPTTVNQSSSRRHRTKGHTDPRHEPSKDTPRVTSRAHAPSDPSRTLGRGREEADDGFEWKQYKSRDQADDLEELDVSGEDSLGSSLTDNGRYASKVRRLYGKSSVNSRYAVDQFQELPYQGSYQSSNDHARGTAENRNSPGVISISQALESTGLGAGTTNDLDSVRQDEYNFARDYQAQQNTQHAAVPSQQQGAYGYEAGATNDFNTIGQPPNEFGLSSLHPSYTSYGTVQSQQQQLYHPAYPSYGTVQSQQQGAYGYEAGATNDFNTIGQPPNEFGLSSLHPSYTSYGTVQSQQQPSSYPSQSSCMPSGHIPEQGYQPNKKAHKGEKRQRRS